MANIFILEPDNLLAGNLRSFFANANHTAYVHSDPQSALTTADEYKPDIVITNLQLAGRSGIEFLYEFRSYSDWQNIPVILLGHLRNEEMTQYTEVFSSFRRWPRSMTGIFCQSE